MDDRVIVELYFERNEAAIKETEKKYSSYLTKIAYNILMNDEDSKESVNDTYLAAWNSIPPQRPTVLKTYLAKLTRRISIDIFRKNNRDKRKSSEYAISLSELEEVISGSSSIDDTIEARILSESIGEFLKQLPKTERVVFVGRYYYCDSLKSITVTEGVEIIGKKAFSCCEALERVHIPSTVEISEYSDIPEIFNYCLSLESIEVAEDNKTVKSVDGVLYSGGKAFRHSRFFAENKNRLKLVDISENDKEKIFSKNAELVSRTCNDSFLSAFERICGKFPFPRSCGRDLYRSRHGRQLGAYDGNRLRR